MSSTPRVLVVDDDAAICELYQEVLTSHGYEVVTAGSRSAALAALDRLNGDVAVLLVDLGLPDADGADVARDATAKYGGRPILYVSGWADDFWQLFDSPERWLVLRKPIPVPQLLAAVQWLMVGGPKPKELG